jgi:hypothetical protein
MPPLPRPRIASRRRVLGWAALLPALALAGCGSGPAAPTATPEPELTSEQILERASRRLAETGSVAFALHVEGDTFVDPLRTIRLLAATGDLQRPDRVATEFRAEVADRAITLQLVTVGDRTWLTNVLTGEWGPAPAEFAYRPDVLFDTQEGLGPVMGKVTGVERLPDEDLDGRPVFHLRADVPDSVVGPLTYYTLKGSPVAVDLWIAQDTFDLLRARLSEPPAADRPNPAVWTLDLSDHGQQVSIEPPV